MQHENNRHNESAANKAAPQTIAGKNEEQAKQRTEPLEGDAAQRKDKLQGDMDNEELGEGLKKE